MPELPLIYVVAAERSGDLLGAGLIKALREKGSSKLRFRGVGGEAMVREGVDSAVDIDGLSILGFFDGLKAYGRVKAKVAETVKDIIRHKPDAVVLIDSWGFMLRVAQGVRAVDPSIRLIKYVGPQVFATRPGRAKTLAAAVDHLLTILSFDGQYYRPHGLPVTFVGNPSLERKLEGDGAAFRARHGFEDNGNVLLVLLGSRPSEIKRLWPIFSKTVRQMAGVAKPVFVIADPVRADVDQRLDADPHLRQAVRVYEDAKGDAFAAADLALACSGTVVTELSTAGIPAVTGYRLGWLTWAIIRAFNIMKAPFISLVNIAAGRMLVEEFVQTRCTSSNLVSALTNLLNSPVKRRKLADAQRRTTRMMRGDGKASEKAAMAVLTILDRSAEEEMAGDNWRETIVRPALALEIGNFEPTGRNTASYFGVVKLARPEETWPMSEGRPMIPLLQLNLEEAAFKPAGLEDLAMICVFLDPDCLPDTSIHVDTRSAPDEENGGWWIRTYKSLDELVPVDAALHGSSIKPAEARWSSSIASDYPCHDHLPVGFEELVGGDYYEQDGVKTLEGTKIGGWPLNVQSEQWWDERLTAEDFRYVLQIDSEYALGWSWGDGGLAYLARSRRDQALWGLDWQCH